MISTLIQEEWRPVRDYENYEVSNFGRIKSLPHIQMTKAKNGKISYAKHKEHILKYKHSNDGYNRVTLRKNGKSIDKTVHRLVAEAFIPNPNNLPIINHRNEIKTDNSVWNLEWCNWSYNLSYNGLRDKMAEKTGTKVRIIKGDFSMDFRSINKAAEYIGCRMSTVWDVANGGRNQKRNGKEVFVKCLTVKGYKIQKIN